MTLALVASQPQSSGKITVTQHAIDEAVKDFRVPRQTAEEWVRSTFRKSRFIANIISAEGKPCRLFGHHRIALVLDATENVVITVYPRHPNNSVTSITRKVDEMLARELRRAERKETRLERIIRLTKAELTVEIAQLELRLLRARSESTKLACQARINAINEYFAQLDADLLATKKEKSAVAKTVVAYI